jgi:hypothetical protein
MPPSRRVSLHVCERDATGAAVFLARDRIEFSPDAPTLEPCVPEGPGELAWTCERGLVRMPVLVSVEDRWDLVLSPTGDLRLEQRREHVRVAQPLPVSVRRRDGRTLKARALDYSGGGLRLELRDGDDELGPGETSELSLKLHDFSNVAGTAVVVRAPAPNVRACAFTRILEPQRERLIRHGFAAMRARLAEARRTGEHDAPPPAPRFPGPAGGPSTSTSAKRSRRR